MEFLNTYGAYIMLYFIFQVGTGTYWRCLSKISNGSITIKKYLILMIPVIGILFAFLLAIRYALSNEE
ncbi:hypothetical protein [uncultured Clostridium sp.]|uniref:hypothetical protein n=1 Tax=uncultured Clostridium sp. TaxID=59620 RepID=UPI00260EF356|nr:hypothetical protein [uncultured Clostridium sp.]